MKTGMNLQDLLSEVIRQNAVKKDFVASTEQNVRMVEDTAAPKGVAVALLAGGSREVQRFGIRENAHKQIADKLGIPTRFYDRLLTTQRDIVVDMANKLFEREPAKRLFRTLDGDLRAVLSDRYLRLDNNEVLEKTLPAIIRGEVATKMLASNVGEKHMDLKVLFTDERFAQRITGKTRTGADRIVQPGFRMRNSETGHGSLSIQGFFYDNYCENGCIFGLVEGFEYRRSHLGGKLIEGVEFEVLSEESRRLEDATIISQVTDVMKAMASVTFAQKMGDALRLTAHSAEVQSPTGAVELAVKELALSGEEKTSILETFLKDGDYSQWGLSSAVTSVANSNIVSFDRASELEDVGGKLLTLSPAEWNRFVTAKAA